MERSNTSGVAFGVQEWLRDNDPAAINHVQVPRLYNEKGVAGRLYELCFESLRLFCRKEGRLSLRGEGGKASLMRLRNELEKLYLWGEAFQDGKLDRALKMDEESKSSVLQLLVDVGDLLIQGKISLKPW